MQKKSEKNTATAQRQQDEYFMEICRKVGEQGTCDRGRSGCIIVKNWEIISTGFVDSPLGSPTCDEIGHKIWKITKDNGEIKEHCMRNNCAELSAIANAAREGISLKGATLYTKMTPCYVRHCVHLIVASGITKVVCEKMYHDKELSEEVLKNAGIELVYLNNETEIY